jgi:glutamyl-tRNA synthetase
MSVRVRFAPSPTGHLHIGGARTALTNWLFARQAGGAFLLRIEDTDPERSRRAHEEQILRDLAWLGLDWDEGPDRGGPVGPYRQSERTARYDEVCERLIAEGKAYRCDATVDELDALREAQKARGEDPRYDRRNRDKGLGADVGPHVVRLKLPIDGATAFDDLVKGRIEIANEKLDDFVLRRTDGSYTYNYVVVVDDVDMGITQVVRGDDHVNNTPKQIHLYHALGAPVPAFGHLPMILGPDGSRLSKRHGDTALGAYRDMGIPQQAMLNYLARLGWAHGDQEVFTADELVRLFALGDVGVSGARWDLDKLHWLSGTWIRALPLDELVAQARPFFEAAGLAVAEDRLPFVVAALQKRAQTLVDLAAQGRFCFVDDAALELDPAASEKFLKPGVGAVLGALADALEAAPSWDEPALTAVVDAHLAATGLKLGKVAQPLRVALTGSAVGPGLYEMMLGVGRDGTLRRIRAAAARCP